MKKRAKITLLGLGVLFSIAIATPFLASCSTTKKLEKLDLYYSFSTRDTPPNKVAIIATNKLLTDKERENTGTLINVLDDILVDRNYITDNIEKFKNPIWVNTKIIKPHFRSQDYYFEKLGYSYSRVFWEYGGYDSDIM